ncbi:MAG: tRNA glutamyl-Q(34) synthetase GluQRS [Proteobacteria bacterium]|nr:tRNA glutamyl-Q(34) synthetase GluQRS [Pseudomonadota bacterium]
MHSDKPAQRETDYFGRLAPTPTGHLHIGHASTFAMAHRRARASGGRIFLRIEDLDPHRCKSQFAREAMEDLNWLGLDWDEKPVFQSDRKSLYVEAWRRLREGGFIYSCAKSRRELSSHAPHEEEPVFPVEWRADTSEAWKYQSPAGANWRFRVPDGRKIAFVDGHCGRVEKTALQDFGDFLVWNRDDIPAYELAVVVDDIAMKITEVVRGEDLLTSTARQILLYEALGSRPPAWYHCPLVRDAQGIRLAKRTGGLSLRDLRASGKTPGDVLKMALK